MGNLYNCIWPAVVSLAFGATLSSCILEDIEACSDRIPFTIENDWRSCPDAAPGGMAYIFFPDDGSEPWRFDFAGRDAGEVKMAPGNYRFLSYNDDTAHVLFRGDGGYDSYKAYTGETDLLGLIPPVDRGESLPRIADERILECPDMMWGCAYYDFSLRYDGVYYMPGAAPRFRSRMEYSPDFVLTAAQRPLTAHYSFRIEDIENLSGVKSMSAALSGMAGAMLIASGVKEDYPSTLTFKASILDAATAGGEFFTFGIPDAPSVPNIFSLFVVLKDGRRFCYRFDVTDRVRSAPDPMNVSLIMRGIKLEEPEPESDAGFDVSVDGWETVIVNIDA